MNTVSFTEYYPMVDTYTNYEDDSIRDKVTNKTSNPIIIIER